MSPVLIAVHRATHVPVGEDQRQHLELTRDIAQMFNQRHATPTFPLPETISSASCLTFAEHLPDHMF